jgi:multiple sugar transport system substrate-binding protein
MSAGHDYDRISKFWQRSVLTRVIAIAFILLTICLLWIVSDRKVWANLIPFHQSKITLSFIMPNDGAAQWQSLINEFEATHPEINIDLVNLRDQDAIKPQDARAVKNLYTDSFTSEEKPSYDLVFMDVIWVAEFAEKHWLAELPIHSTDPTLMPFLRDDVLGGVYKNRLYRMPVRSDIGWLYYRTDLLKKAGLKPPETFEELIVDARKLQSQGLRWGYLWQGRQSESLSAMFIEVLHGQGGFWINPETLEVGLDRPEAISAVQFLHRTMFDEKPVSPKTLTTYQEQETLRLFLEGDAAFLRNWSSVLTRATLEDSGIRNKIGLKPMVHALGYASGGCQGSWGLGIALKTQHPKEAWQAVQYFTSAAAQRKLYLDASDGLPTQRELFKDPQLVKRYSYYPAILDSLENQKPHPVIFRPAIPQYAQATCILQRYLHTTLTQENPNIAQMMRDVASDTRILLKTTEGTLKEKSCIANSD